LRCIPLIIAATSGFKYEWQPRCGVTRGGDLRKKRKSRSLLRTSRLLDSAKTCSQCSTEAAPRRLCLARCSHNRQKITNSPRWCASVRSKPSKSTNRVNCATKIDRYYLALTTVLQQPRRYPLLRQHRHGLFIERNKRLRAKPSALVRNHAVGKIPARIQHS
jgi:hypothetical protein